MTTIEEILTSGTTLNVTVIASIGAIPNLTGSVQLENINENAFNVPNGIPQLDNEAHLKGIIISRTGTEATINDMILEAGEYAFCTDTKQGRIGDGTTSGGISIKDDTPYPNVITNGGFDTDLSGWYNSGSSWAWDSGTARNSGNHGYLRQTVSTEANKYYRFHWETSGGTIGLRLNNESAHQYYQPFVFKTTTSTTILDFLRAVGVNVALDNVSVNRLDEEANPIIFNTNVVIGNPTHYIDHNQGSTFCSETQSTDTLFVNKLISDEITNEGGGNNITLKENGPNGNTYLRLSEYFYNGDTSPWYGRDIEEQSGIAFPYLSGGDPAIFIVNNDGWKIGIGGNYNDNYPIQMTGPVVITDSGLVVTGSNSTITSSGFVGGEITSGDITINSGSDLNIGFDGNILISDHPLFFGSKYAANSSTGIVINATENSESVAIKCRDTTLFNATYDDNDGIMYITSSELRPSSVNTQQLWSSEINFGTLANITLSSSTTDNLNIGNYSLIRLNPDGSDKVVTGIAPSQPGKIGILYNVGTGNITFKNNNTSSNATSRILTATGGDIVITTNQCLAITYDNQTGRIRELFHS